MFNFMRLPPLRRLMLMKAITGGGSWSTISGNPVSFTAKAAPLRKLEVAFSPKQDLHGYDAPWPAGGGANKWDEEWEVGSIYDETGANNDNVDTLIRSKNYIPVSAETAYYAQLSNGNAHIFCYDSEKTYINYIDRVGRGTFTTLANTAYIRFRLNNAYGTTYNHDVAINYPSSVTTYSPYSNVCPILGWDSLTVEQRGKNLLDPDTFDSYTAYTVNADGSITISAGNSSAWGSDVNKPVFLKAGTYTLSRTEASGRCAVRSSLNNYGSEIAVILPSAYNATFTLTEDAFIKIKINTGASEYPVTSFFMLELGSTASAFVPYASRSITISLGETVYSGYVDLVTGVVTVDMAKITKKWSEFANKEVGVTYAEGRVYLSNFDSSKRTSSICDCLKYSSDGADYGKCFYAPSSGNYFRAIVMNTVSDDDEFTFVYPIATPLTIQLTPQEVESLAGDNTMWTDAASLEVTYRSN